MIALVAAAVALAAVAGWALTRTAPAAAPAKLARVLINRPPGELNTGGGSFALAPDGSAVVFVVAGEGDSTQLWIRELDDPAGRAIAGTDKASFPFWSPDSRHIGFFADGKLRRVPRSGGAAQSLCDAPNGRGGAWSPAGTIVFAPAPFSALSKVNASGGAPEPATTLDAARGQTSHRFPSFLPDGRHFVFSTQPQLQSDLYQIDVASLDDPVARPLLAAGGSPRYADPGYLLFPRGQVFMAQRIDLGGPKMAGDPIPLAERAEVQGPISGVQTLDCARNGTLVYDQADRRPTEVAWFGRDGRLIKSVFRHPVRVFQAAVSHHGDRLALIDFGDAGLTLLVADLATGTSSRLSRPERVPEGLAWTPDDSAIVTSVLDGGKRAIVAFDPRSGAERTLLPPDVRFRLPSSVAPDGTVTIDELIAGRLYDIVALPRGGNETRPYIATPANERVSAVSPDGRLVAYTSDTSGRREIYVDGFPEHSELRRVSTEGANEGVWWRDDGRELYFGSIDGKSVLACDVATSPTLKIGSPHVVFELQSDAYFLPAPRGDRLLVMAPVGELSNSLVLVQNWAAQLEKHE